MQPDDTFNDLPSDVLKRIKELCKKGLEDKGKNDLDEAIYSWEQAIQLLPDPREEWGISCWLLRTQASYTFSRRIMRRQTNSSGGQFHLLGHY